MGPFGRAAVGLIVNKDGTSKKKKEDGVGSLKGGRRNAGTLPSWLKDDLPDEKTAKDGKEKPVKEGKDKWVKESKEKNKKSSSSGKSHIDEEVEMEISAPIPDEDFRLATSLLGLNRIKTRSGPLHFPAASTRSGPVFAGTVQSRFDTGNEGKREDKAVNSWSKGESSTKLLSGGRKASKVHARDSVSPEEFSPAEESSYNRRSSLPGESTDMGASPLSETSPGSLNLKKLQRSSRIGELEKAFGGRPGSGLKVEGSGDGSHSGSQFGSSWAPSAGGSRGVGNPSSLRAPDFSSLGPSMDHKSSHGKASDDDAEAQEAESPTESPRFKALLRMTGSKGKRPTDIKSFSHELDPRGVRSHEFFRPHNLGGFNDLEEFLNTLRARFNTAKEEVNAELAVFAGDVIEILEKNADAAPDWQEKAEDLLILAKECAMMNAQEFRKSCEAIVHDLDEKRQELSMGVLKQLHTRLLFILTRCTRLLQYQKRNFLELDLLRLQKVEKFWQEDNVKRPLDVRSDPVKIRKPSSPPRFRPNDVGSIQRRPKDEGVHSKPSMPSIRETEPKADLTANKVEDIKDELSNIIIDRITSWKKFPPPSERKSSVERPDLKQQTPEKDPSQFSPSLFPPLKQRIPEHDPGLAKVSKPQPPPKRQQKVPPQDEKPMVICRICEEEVPTVHLEEHSRVCAFADRCDHKGLGVDERLRRLAETLEHLVESYTPKSSLVAASASPDTAKTSSGGDPETIIAEKLTSVSEKLGAYERGGGDQFCRGSEDMLEDLHEIDTASILDEPRVFNAIACKTRFGPKADPLVTLASSVGSLLAPSSSVGSITPRSPLATPKNSQIDLLLADRSNFAESENLQQINELADIARCIADRCPAPDKGGSEYIVECLEDLKDVLQQNRVEALTVDTFGRRIEKLCREKHQQILEALGQHTPESFAHTPDENITTEDDGSQNCTRTPVHPIHKDRTSIDDFEIIKPISRGAFGRVFLARKRITGDLFAIKVLRKADMIRKNAVESVQAERNILISVRNPFVVRFFYSFTCSVNLYLVMEYLNGGDVFSMLRNLGCLEEEMARVYIAELVLALEYLHGLGVVHRDLKPDNLLIAHDGHIKLTDFGLSKVGLINSTDDLSGPTVGGASLMEEITKHHKASDQPQQRERRQQRSAVGTPDYLAPEILLGTSHGPAADWWSTGVILFECLTGMPPFNAEHPQIIFDNILNRNIPWPQVPEDMSYEAQDLIDRLLTEDPDERLGAKGAAEVKAHPFFKDINWDTLARQKAAFVPSPDNAHDTSYFTSRHGWNSVEARVFTEHGYESSDYESSASGRSTSSSERGPEESELIDVAGPLIKEQCRDMADFDRDSSTKFSFSNFSFKNLSQLASINYDLLLQTSQDAALPKGPATSPS